MVTGDNIHTARHIARECGILTDEGVALEGPAFRTMPAHELMPLLPRLQVGRGWGWVAGVVMH
jgi:Ca2+-transporting ATPase